MKIEDDQDNVAQNLDSIGVDVIDQDTLEQDIIAKVMCWQQREIYLYFPMVLYSHTHIRPLNT